MKIHDYNDWVLSKVKGKTVLDIGGWGTNPPHPSNRFVRIAGEADVCIGIDTNKQAVSHSAFVSDPKSAGIDYDVITMTEVVEHMVNPTAELTMALGYATRPSIVIVVPNPWSLFTLMNVFFCRDAKTEASHTSWLCPYTLRCIVAGTRLQVVETVALYNKTRWYAPAVYLLMKLNPWLCSWWGFELKACTDI